MPAVIKKFYVLRMRHATTLALSTMLASMIPTCADRIHSCSRTDILGQWISPECLPHEGQPVASDSVFATVWRRHDPGFIPEFNAPIVTRTRGVVHETPKLAARLLTRYDVSSSVRVEAM